jgi:hypothetical protein
MRFMTAAVVEHIPATHGVTLDSERFCMRLVTADTSKGAVAAKSEQSQANSRTEPEGQPVSSGSGSGPIRVVDTCGGYERNWWQGGNQQRHDCGGR